MDPTVIYATIGFLLAAYSVIGNDCVQTLGTFIASNRRIFKWYVLWAAASTVLVATLIYGWVAYDGDISFGRLEKIPPVDIQWYHAAAPAVLVALTRVGVPVSTTFLVLSVFASTVVLEQMLVKSIMGYVVAGVTAYVLWIGLARMMNERMNLVKPAQRLKWRILQWGSTGFLWYSWLSHDMANIAVFLPRPLPLEIFILAMGVLVAGLAYTFWAAGGPIQRIVIEKTGARYMRSATVIDFIYALILLFFKEYNSIPMSTTWVFVGLLTGRELAIATCYRDWRDPSYVFPLVFKDFLKMMAGLIISVALVMGVHYLS